MTTRQTDEPTVMRELHELRERLHDEWKNLTPQQVRERLHADTAETIKRLDLRVERDDNASQQRRVG